MRSDRMHERLEARLNEERFEQSLNRPRNHLPSDPMVTTFAMAGLALTLFFGWLIWRHNQLNPEFVVYTGSSVHNIRTGMTYDQVEEVAGQPARSVPPNAFEEPHPPAAVLFYEEQTERGREYRVYMQGNTVDSWNVTP